MKKFSILFSSLLTAASVFASNAGSTAVRDFYTMGPDTYTDGSPVLAGETYLFVYVPNGSSFGGVDTAGKLVTADNALLGRAAAWVDPATGFVRCPFRSISYSTAEYPAGGSFYVVLLDTRKDAATVGGHVDGYSIGAQGASGSSAAPLGATIASANGNAFASGFAGGSAASLLNVATDTPVIKDISVGADGSASVTLDNLRAVGSYTIQETDSLGKGWQDAPVQKVQDAAGSQSVKVPAPIGGATVRFFKVFAK